jgi:hypothetical protein
MAGLGVGFGGLTGCPERRDAASPEAIRPSHKWPRHKEKNFLRAKARFCVALNVGAKAPTPEMHL